MERKIATLEVFVRDQNNGVSSHLDYGDEENGRYKIVLNPEFIRNNVPWTNKKAPWHELAHELGHFIARLAKRPSHVMSFFYGPLPAEIEAWEIAHEEVPIPDEPSSFEKDSIESYKST